MAICRFKAGGSNVHRSLSIFGPRVIVAAEMSNVEKFASSDGGAIHEEPGEIIKPDAIVEDVDKDWDFEGIMKAKELKASKLQSKMSALQ